MTSDDPIRFSDFRMSFSAQIHDPEWAKQLDEISHSHQMKIEMTFRRPSPWKHPIRWRRFRKNFGPKIKSVTMTMPNATVDV